MSKLPIEKKQAYFFTDSLTIEYLIGLNLADAYLVYSDKPVCFADARTFSAVKGEIEKRGVEARLFKNLDDIKKLIKERKIKKLYIDFDSVTLSKYYEYLGLGAKLLDCSRALTLAKAVKSEAELNNIKKACDIAQKAFHTVLKEIKKGVKESYIRDRLEQEMLSLGAEDIAFETIVAFGEHATVPHHETGDTELTDNSVILVDMGCKVNGYCSDITRTVFFGKPSQKFIDCYEAVLSANKTAIENITDGMTTDVADGFARNLLKEKGIAEYFTHSLGHGVGQYVHEFPYLTPRKKDVLEDGMVFTIEPGVYFDGEFGIRIEDTVALINGKVERLFTDDKKLILI